jgi:hypothetical protein
MKTAINSMRYKIPLLVMTLLATVYSFAQEVTEHASHSSSSTSTTTAPETTEMWYNAPWVWIIGAGVLLLILLLLIRGGSSNDHTVRRTTRTTTTVHSDY